jgi:hypothetical protein
MERRPLVIIYGRIQELPASDSILGGDAMPTLTKRVDFVGDDTIYIGYAVPGSLTSGAVWQISKIVTSADGDVVVTFANGNALYNNIWDNRLSISYT